MDDDLVIDRYALGVLPGECRLIAEWLRETRDYWIGGDIDASEEEKERLRPGLDLLLERITEDLADAEMDTASLVSVSNPTLLLRSPALRLAARRRARLRWTRASSRVATRGQ